MRAAVTARDGREVDTQGDSFFFAFPRANAALGAAVAAQRALAAHDWPEGGEMRVRMGLHTGEPAVGDERYVGIGVHRAARIGAVGARRAGAAVQRDARAGRGRRRRRVAFATSASIDSRTSTGPSALFQLDIDGLQTDFPPVRAEKVAEPHPYGAGRSCSPRSPV